ncbi:UDP-N-acetylmuramoylalanyl-D-glutamyl-2,6-diaminopimelate--D-alanyl-D-alanine ligase [[Actinomadura] parvosata subsp. kistnae]|uniref:UDP-N-acetylmuramoyl-tripeptide--D-alanyl-D-alanine ligase n=1 Tax=[Actinomadura] parvosata subsp. kistnae TaxID=1909395 RepID=A0A1V0AH33_9ACTN|nr:UDP-N-acetylmuramoyl-tripeptide--D-alanyl-D-alanine ligase [Nonomuraea sp. ATCC 55076]AQZ69510.1 UDP-N-acetylmuramoyl-tripeptide--D-alanyl-D-alanine ligase [Nonomuraea sp. ATCC 55076]SPL91824.1 UDP-N-acetylmuramoylalanyl-D-glutamyl-2,6-diaminopimelate--D-alanyl-D-alanine ligase [Actinomadura parvosata subsp. kistnae]
MIPMTLDEIARVVGGRPHDVPDPQSLVTAPAAVDSREVVPGGLFVATAGAHVDGHDFAAAAVASGAASVLATRPVGVPAVVVEDVQTALGLLARHVLGRLGPAVIGLTGSVGKTTTKDLLAQVLERHGPTVATDRSFNNELGLPLTVLRADPATRYLVLEMGASRKGDLTYLTGIAPPHVGLVLNVGNAHVERMGGGLADVAQAKGELVEALPPGGLAVLNADDPHVAGMAGRTKAQILWYGGSAPVRAENVRMDGAARPAFELVTPTGRAPVTLDLIGAHQVSNAVAAAAVATALGLDAADIAAGLTAARRRSAGRLEIVERPDGTTIVNDAYNANPESMRAGLRAAKALAGARRTVAVLGAMGQQADASRARHAEIGRLVADLGYGVLIAVGDGDPLAMAEAARAAGQGVAVHTAEDAAEAVTLATALLQPGDVVLVKASSEIGLAACARALAATS